MVEIIAAISPLSVAGIPTPAAPANPSRTLKALKAAVRDHAKAQRRTADDAFVTRVNDRIDAALELPITTLLEAEAMARLLLASEQEDLHEIQIIALKSIADVLAAAVKTDAN